MTTSIPSGIVHFINNRKGTDQMITESQIQQIREAGSDTVKLAKLCNGWEADIRAKQMSKGGKIELHLKNRKEEIRVVIATLLTGGVFAWHKDAWSKQYTITHVKTKLALATGSLKQVKSACVYLTDNVDFWQIMDVENDKLLHLLNTEQLDIMQKAARIVKGEYYSKDNNDY